MKEEELFDSIDGLMAYDHGSIDSGIHDDQLRKRVLDELQKIRLDGRGPHQIYSKKFNKMMARYINRYFLSDKAIEQGYGFEDVVVFIKWIQEWMKT
jgi:hypothetical protein